MREILLIDTIHPAFSAIVEKKGFIVKDVSALTKSDIKDLIDTAEGLVVRSRFPIDKELIDAGTRLHFIARAGAGMENIDVSYAQARNIHCLNAPEGNRDAVAEHALGMLLALFNNLTRADSEVRKGNWNREANRGSELHGKTVAIIGFGNMGSAFAQRLQGFEVNIIVYDKYKSVPSASPVKQVELDDIFENADIVSLHVPLTDETHYMVNADFIRSFRKNIYIINTARGRNVNTEDLVNGLISGKIKGACLDVIEYEDASFEQLGQKESPLPMKYLLESDKVILTPHIAGWSFESHRKISEVMAHKVLALYKKQPH